MSSRLRVWLKFNTVGLFGAGVQLLTFTMLETRWGLNYLTSTIVAVETAVLHNFVWHIRWTWPDRHRLDLNTVLDRLMRFHLANGLISIGGNVVLMWAFVSRAHMPHLLATVMSIGTCATFNFLASDRLVFRKSPAD